MKHLVTERVRSWHHVVKRSPDSLDLNVQGVFGSPLIHNGLLAKIEVFAVSPLQVDWSP